MDEQIKQIAERLQGLREVLELTAKDIARDCDISECFSARATARPPERRRNGGRASGRP